MIADFDDFSLWVYVVVDDIWQQIAPLFKRPGPEPACSDSELIAMALIGECKGWDQETELISNWQEHRDLFPEIPERSRFNRRRRNLMQGINLIRQLILSRLDLTLDHQTLIDSLPLPVVQFHLVPGSSGEWGAFDARYGRVPSKKQTIFGYKLHLLITLGGLILDFELAPANASDLHVGHELLAQHTDLQVLGDKAYISAEVAAELLRSNRIALQSLPRRNQAQQATPTQRRVFNAARQMIETVNSQLAAQFNIETTHAHSFWGLSARLYTKLTAHTLCIYLNRLLGNPDFLQIKALAFPI